MLSFIPFLVLIVLVTCCIAVFGNATLDGASQVLSPLPTSIFPVLVPWNTCGLTQSTVLGVATLTYLPYCFFNYLSPLMSIFIASIGWKIKRRCS